jgi:hypothetical protein
MRWNDFNPDSSIEEEGLAAPCRYGIGPLAQVG